LSKPKGEAIKDNTTKKQRANRQVELQTLESKYSGWSEEAIKREQIFNPELQRLLDLRRLSKQPGW